MFLLVSVRHVGAHPDGHQHGVSIQISINLGKTFLRISRTRNIPLTWNLGTVFAYIPPFISQVLGFIYWTVLIFILIYFEWRDSENQEFIYFLIFFISFFYTIFFYPRHLPTPTTHDPRPPTFSDTLDFWGETVVFLAVARAGVMRAMFPVPTPLPLLVKCWQV